MGKRKISYLKWKEVLSNYWPLLVLFFVAIFILRSLFLSGFPETHDGQNHLARLANLKAAIADGHFPFRWAPNLNYQFGYPVFNFNYYLPQIMGLIPAKLGFSFEDSLKLVLGLSLIMGGVFWYLFLRESFGKIAALTAGLMYITAPYQLVNILVRGSVGEVVSAGILPGLLWSINRLINSFSRLWLGITTLFLIAFLLSHNIIVMIGMPFLIAFSLVEIWRKRKWGVLFWIGLVFILAIGITQFFWLPALLEKQYTNLDFVNLSQDYINHFPRFTQLIHSSWGHGFSKPGPIDGFSFELGPFHWLTVILAISLFLFKKDFRKKKENYFLGIFFGLVFGLTILFMNEITIPAWKLIPFLHYIQFPWRLLIFSILASAFFAGWLTKRFPFLGLGLSLGAVIYIIVIAQPKGRFNWDDFFYHAFPFNSSVLGENMPKWFYQEKNLQLSGKIFDLGGISSIREISWKTQYHEYEIRTPNEVTIAERTAYFPGWETYIDGERVEIDYQLPEYPGMISFVVPEGKHKVETIFTENTPARRWGDAISIISIIVLGIILLKNWGFHGKAK